jgi:hypothetical protein
MATLRQMERAFGPFHNADEIYCLQPCQRCGEDTEPYNGRYLVRTSDGRWKNPVESGDTELGYWALFGKACAKRVLDNNGIVPALTNRERRKVGW